MNRIAIIERNGNPRRELVVDDRSLTEHFVGRTGSHPSQVFAIGWTGAKSSAVREVVEQFLGLRSSGLVSGRVPVLVCEECGDVACGALAVRIERRGGVVTWSDWAYENGYEPSSLLSWSTYPASFAFDVHEYEKVFRNAASDG